MPSLGKRIQKAWNAFRNKDPTQPQYVFSYGSGGNLRPDRRAPSPGTERSIIAPLLNRIAVDCAAVDIRHVKLDDQKRYKEDVDDDLNKVLTLSANIDQTGRAFKQDIYASLLDEGYIAICPVDADIDYSNVQVIKLKTARVGRILRWYPTAIDVELYNERNGKRETVKLPKSICVILQNPFYEIMNAPNSLMRRLRRKLALLDEADEKVASGKLDMIIQLPYSTRHETQKQRAEERRHDLEVQLAGSKYGIGYIDASEKVIQLGKTLDNNLQAQIETLTKQLHDQLGVTPDILNGNANEMTKINYINNIIEPLVTTVTDGLNRIWLSDNMRSHGHAVMSFMNAFRVVPPTEVAKLGDTLIRNMILTANEMRGILGFKPSEQEEADMLNNPNMPFDMQAGGSMLQPVQDENGNIPEHEEIYKIPVSQIDDAYLGNGEESPDDQTEAPDNKQRS